MKSPASSLNALIKNEPVLFAAGLLAVLSAFFIPPSPAYIDYLDFRVLALLLSLMLVVSGLENIGVFHLLGSRLLSGIRHTRQLVFVLMALCFFSSMVLTNDVALLTFVPFAILILSMAKASHLLIPTIVLQTIAANLGSMFTPIGNPQNLYLYSITALSPGDFLTAMLPLTAVSFLLLITAVLFIKKTPVTAMDIEPSKKPDLRRLFLYLALFCLCLGCVAHKVPYGLMTIAVVLSVALSDRKLLRTADYKLLLTFVCFFVFIGNIQQIPAVSAFLSAVIQGREFLFGVGLSQIISNVPAAILLSGFTDQMIPLLYGVNIGGLGTLIASLASLISYRFYCGTEGAEKGRYLAIFTAANAVFLVLLCGVSVLCLRTNAF